MTRETERPTEIHFFKHDHMFNRNIYFKIYEFSALKEAVYHSHNYMQIWYVKNGSCSHWINNREYKLVQGDIFILPPYIVHRVAAIAGEKITIVGCEFSSQFIDDKNIDFEKNCDFFNFAYLKTFMVAEDLVKPKFNISAECRPIIESIMQDMLQEYTAEKRFYEMIIKADLLKLLAILAREYANSPEGIENEELFNKYRTAINSTIEFINENYSSELRLEDLCKYSFMSKTYFCFIFKSIVGQTFTEYLISVRMKKATELLSKTNMTVTNICFAVGFNDVTHFCRTFKRTQGVSPNYYRKMSSSGLKLD